MGADRLYKLSGNNHTEANLYVLRECMNFLDLWPQPFTIPYLLTPSGKFGTDVGPKHWTTTRRNTMHDSLSLLRRHSNNMVRKIHQP